MNQDAMDPYGIALLDYHRGKHDALITVHRDDDSMEQLPAAVFFRAAQEIDLEKIDYIIANHAEVDHSGAQPELMRHIPDTPIYCTKNGVRSLKGHYHQGWNFNVVTTGERLSLGEKELIFIEAPMLHWPDSMFCYLTQDNILFSNDAFGQHYASEKL